MATKTFYATRDIRNPTNYGTRMLKAGSPVDLDGPKARLYLKLGAVSPTKPRGQRAAEAPVEAPVAPAKPRAPRKRKSTAKK